MGGSFGVNKIELKRILTSFKVSDKNIEGVIAQMDRMHRHVNVLTFTEMLQGVGLRQDDIANILRRVGMNDVTISDIFDVLEEERIRNSFGKIIDLTVE